MYTIYFVSLVDLQITILCTGFFVTVDFRKNLTDREDGLVGANNAPPVGTCTRQNF